MNQQLLFIFFALSVLAACEKPTPANVDPQLVITLTDSIKLAAVDSARVIFTGPHLAEPITRTFNKTGATLSVSIKDVIGNGNLATIQVFTPGGLNGVVHQFDRTQSLSGTGADGLNLSGPRGRKGGAWKGWALVRTAEADLRLPLDLTDPYFDLQLKRPDKWDYIYAGRQASVKRPVGAEVVVGRSWECGTGGSNPCIAVNGRIENVSAFGPFSQLLAGNYWDIGGATFIIMDTRTGEEFVLFYNWRY